jgi:predicted metal-binding membrane protein
VLLGAGQLLPACRVTTTRTNPRTPRLVTEATLPGAAPAVLRRARAGGVRAVPLFAGAYLAVWALAGVAVYAAYRPHGTPTAGAVVIAAAVYEGTPLKRQFRRRCRAATGSGFKSGFAVPGRAWG